MMFYLFPFCFITFQATTRFGKCLSMLPTKRGISFKPTRIAAQIANHDLRDEFSRWRFIQRLLDEDTTAADGNRVLFHVLDGFLKSPPSVSDEGADFGVPELTDERRALIEELLEGANDLSIGALSNSGDTSNDFILSKLEKLLPDPVEDEDAYKTVWDLLIEIHGRESVKINERKPTPEWRSRALVAQILLYYDFLHQGLYDGTPRT